MLDVYLLTTDTVLPRLAATIMEQYFRAKPRKRLSIKEIVIIKNLQVADASRFKNIGLGKLIRQIDTISAGDYTNLVFNITGGYKAVIPYLTLMAQAHRIPAYYVFEEAKEKQLLEIPLAPVEIDWESFVAHHFSE